MKALLGLAASLSLACAIPAGPSAPIPVSVRSHNRSDVDVYLLCGNRDASLLGLVGKQESMLFELPASRTRCVSGLNFFLVRRDINRGYWVGPFRPAAGSWIDLTIERYAGLSSVRVGW